MQGGGRRHCQRCLAPRRAHGARGTRRAGARRRVELELLPVVSEGDGALARSGFLAAGRRPTLHHARCAPATPIAGHQLAAPHMRQRD
jgi:hypothetical protein